jgi:hypothetical protein
MVYFHGDESRKMLTDYLQQSFTHTYDISDSLINIHNIFIQNHLYGLIVLLENVCENNVTLSGEYGISISPNNYIDISSEFCKIGTDFGFLQKSQKCNGHVSTFIHTIGGEFKEKCIGEFVRLVFNENKNLEILDTFEDDIYNIMEKNGQQIFITLIDDCVMTDDILEKIEGAIVSNVGVNVVGMYDDVKDVVENAVENAVENVVEKKDVVVKVNNTKKHRYLHTRRVHGRRSITPIRRRVGVSKTHRKNLARML